jgi:cellobiose phosphorylase
LCHEVSLAPGASESIIYLMGVTDSPSAIKPTLTRYGDLAEVDRAFQALRADWESYFSKFRVETPDSCTNSMTNFLDPLQCRTTLHWSRFVSGYETGLGRGIGTRDTAQDILGVLHAVPDEAASRLAKLWELQFRDGHTWHQFFPLEGVGGPGLAAEKPSWPQWFCDDHLWLIIATCAYLKETGDYGYLERPVAYQPEERSAIASERPADTIWGHMMAAIGFTLAHRGPHGLPRPGFADWDDTLNVDHGSGLAESVWCAMQFCRATLDLAELADYLSRRGEAKRFRKMKQEMAEAVNRSAWDGSWYARCFDDQGQLIGVSSEERQRISLIPQSWCVIGEVAPPERARRAMESAHELLNTPYGLALMWPPYDGGDPRVNGTSTYPPGAKENGGIFCHASAWSVVAAASLGQGDRAYQYYRELLPLTRPDLDQSKVEPYVYCQNICGPSHPQFGLGRNAWLTGAAAWMYLAVTQWLLGIRPTHAGLRVAPTLPSSWSGFSALRLFRDCWYEITVSRQGSGNTVSLTVDGIQIEGDTVPLPPSGTTRVLVEVVLR